MLRSLRSKHKYAFQFEMNESRGIDKLKKVSKTHKASQTLYSQMRINQAYIR